MIEQKPKDCPKCGSDDIDVDSNASMRISEVSCGDCGHKMQGKVCEESMVERWNKAATAAKKGG